MSQEISEVVTSDNTPSDDCGTNNDIIRRHDRSITKDLVDIGSRLEMLIDSWLVDNQEDVSLQIQQPRPQEIVWRNEMPWEGSTCCYFSVLDEGSRVRLYYRGGEDDVAGSVTAYAESSDGIHFEKPNLNLYDYKDSCKNNIVFKGCDDDSYASHNFAPFLDTNPQALPEERYKATGGYRLPDYSKRALYAFSSPDGIRWKKMQNDPIIEKGKLDSFNIAFWDSNAGLYRCYSRYMEEDAGTLRRAIQSSTSPDFKHWSPVQRNLYDVDPPEFYTNATVPAPNAPHILLSFPMRYLAKRKKIEEHPFESLSDAIFMTSRDGVHWDSTFSEAWIRPGRDQRNWTDRSNMPAWGIAVTADDEFSIYVSEHYRWADTRLRRYTVRRDGFASMHAGAQSGEWTTRPLLFSGSSLILNYSTSAAGSLRVELQDGRGNVLPGFSLEESEELYGDELDAVAHWKSHSDLSALQNQPIRLRFVMQEADLFSLRFF
jgi:hypothetical protein